MSWVWTWGGSSFGWIDEDALYTQEGRHVGYVDHDDDDVLVFSITDGRYLGQADGDRLITKQSRMGRTRRPRRERRRRTARRPRMARKPRRMRRGYSEFPLPETL